MPPTAALTFLTSRTGRWLYLITAVGLFCSCSAQTSRQQRRPVLHDFTRFFAPQLSGDSHPAATSAEASPENEGFVEPLDFSALMKGPNVGAPSATHTFFRQHGQHPFGAQYHGNVRPAAKQGAFRFIEEPLPLFGASSNADVGFRPEDFIKSNRGGNQKSFTFFEQIPQAQAKPSQRLEAQPTRQTTQKVEQPFEEDESFDNTEADEEPLFNNENNEEESVENNQPASSSASTSKRREESPSAPAKDIRYPSYSSYYHATPTVLTRQEEKPAGGEEADEGEKDDYETRFTSNEEDELNIKVDDSDENEGAETPKAQQPARPPPAKYAGGYTAPKIPRPVASSTDKQKTTYSDDPFFDDPPDFPAIKIPTRETGARSLGAQLPELAYIRPVQYGNLEHRRPKPFRPSQPDPLYAKAVSSVPSYDFDHSPSAEYREAYLKPQRVTYARSAALTAPIPAETNSKAAANKKANCKRVSRQISDEAVPKGRFQREAMTCFVCDDPTSGGTYEQCAYGSEPKTQAYYVGRSQQYRSDKDKPFTYRQRRFLYNPKPSSPLAAAAPLPTGEEGALTRKTRQEPDVFSGFSFDTDGTFDDKGDYRFGPEFFVKDEEPEKGESSQVKAAETTTKKDKTPENCKKVVKKDMICMVCKSKSGDNYEQCSYGDQPKQHSYSYGRSASYGSPKKPYTERHRRYIGKGNGASKTPAEKFGAQNEKPEASPKRKRNDEAQDEEEKQEDEAEEGAPKETGENNDPTVNGAATSENAPKKEEVELVSFDFDHDFLKKPSLDAKVAPNLGKESTDSLGKQSKYDDYFSFLFPEYSKAKENVKKADDADDPFDTDDDDHYPAESKDLTADFAVPDYFGSSEPKKDIEKMLGEFAKKDRSECKKVMKDQMTCFQCVDAKGMQQEECMFVAASEPKTSHLAYHESKEYKKKEENPTKTPTESKSGSDSLTSSTADTVKTTEATTSKPVTRSRGTKKHDSVTTATTPSPQTTAAPAETKNRKQTLTRHTRGVVPVEELPKKTSAAPVEKTAEEGYEVEEDSPDSGETGESAAVSATAAETNPNNEPPSDFKVPEGPEGLYSEETKPVFDKRFQLSLPKYMLSKSEHEAIFDEVMSSGS